MPLKIETNELIHKAKYIGLDMLSKNWEAILKEGARKHLSLTGFLTNLVEKEYNNKTEKTRLARINRAKIPEKFVLETFPFTKQPRLDKKVVYQLYDSLSFMKEKQDLIFIGPTGCGKTGLAVSFLLHAINHGSRGLFTDFSSLITRLLQSGGDRTEGKLMKKLAAYDLLLIDELGYKSCDKEQGSLFFDLVRRRHKNSPTIITTQLGFDEWGLFLQNNHMTAAMLDRFTVNCAVFNMKDCISIRPRKVVYAVKKKQ